MPWPYTVHFFSNSFPKYDSHASLTASLPASEILSSFGYFEMTLSGCTSCFLAASVGAGQVGVVGMGWLLLQGRDDEEGVPARLIGGASGCGGGDKGRAEVGVTIGLI